MNGGLGLCLMFVLAAAQVGESSSGKVAGHNDDDDGDDKNDFRLT